MLLFKVFDVLGIATDNDIAGSRWTDLSFSSKTCPPSLREETPSTLRGNISAHSSTPSARSPGNRDLRYSHKDLDGFSNLCLEKRKSTVMEHLNAIAVNSSCEALLWPDDP